MDVGVIGVGHMGTPIARNLLRAGHRVTVWNRSPDALDPLIALGAQRAETPEATSQGELLLSTLFDDTAVRSIFLTERWLAAARPGLIHACLSTISPVLSEELTRAHREHGLHYVASPMFGRPEAAAAVQLHFVVAGDPADVERLEPVLRTLGRPWRFGEVPSHAHLAKAAGNFLLTSTLEGLSEACALLAQNGADVPAFVTILTGTLFSSPVYRTYGPGIAGVVEPSGGVPATLGLKDIGVVLDAAHRSGVPLPLAELVRESFRQSIAMGLADKDWSIVFREVARSRARG